MILQKKFLSLILTFVMIFLVGCDGGAQGQQMATRDVFLMNTYMTVTAYGEAAGKAVDEAIGEINRLDALLSTGRDDSEVSRLNRTSSAEVSEDVAYLYEKSKEYYEQTEGAFDITVYPLMQAWGFTDEKKDFRVPSQKELKELLERVDCGALTWDGKRLTLPAGVQIDFGGIAKGYTSYRLKEIFSRNNVDGAIVSLGGNVETYGAKEKGKQWNVGITNPETSPLPGEYIGLLSIDEKAVVTSGGYERYFEKDGKRYHHILNPKTGLPAETGLISVTIVCADGTQADALSTALFVMGQERGKAYWQKRKEEFDVVWLASDGTIRVTEGLADSFQSEHKYEIVHSKES